MGAPQKNLSSSYTRLCLFSIRTSEREFLRVKVFDQEGQIDFRENDLLCRESTHDPVV